MEGKQWKGRPAQSSTSSSGRQADPLRTGRIFGPSRSQVDEDTPNVAWFVLEVVHFKSKGN